MSSSKVDDWTLEVYTATAIEPVAGCAAGSKSGRRERASATTLSRPSIYSTETSYSANNDNQLAIRSKKGELFTATRKYAWSV